ncbi:MAG TPA: transketolase C-terminal domain-containing protein [Gemmataceae bacterium]|nr:transketolase C-terminal domain-containing protein [Gemmataceae bacterium]
MRDTFARTLYQIAKTKPNVFIVVADISPAGSMGPFREEFPDRFVNVGVAEQCMIGVCAGLALRGCTAFAYSIATFSAYRPFEQIRVDLCYQNLPVTVVGIGGGVSYSTLGGTHHAQEDVGVLSALPNMAIVAPCDPLETEAATWACARRNGPTYLRLGKAGEPNLTADAPEPFVFGKVRTIRPGNGVCILSYGPIVRMAVKVAADIEAHGCSVAVVSVHTLKPLDVTGIAELLSRFETVVVLEEHSERGGLAAMVKQVAWDRAARGELLTFSLKDDFIHEFGSHADLLRAHGLTETIIRDRVAAALVRKGQGHGRTQPPGSIPAFQTPHRRAG